MGGNTRAIKVAGLFKAHRRDRNYGHIEGIEKRPALDNDVAGRTDDGNQGSSDDPTATREKLVARKSK
jgi:hypothetical protein